MKRVYGEFCIYFSKIYEWFKQFKKCPENVRDDKHPGPSKAVVTESNIEKVREFIKN